jgi:hypothetical protein
MSYEKRMKELMERLVSMTPEPPPYPEEITMATEVTRRKPRPVLVFVGAAALVALLAIPVILMTGGEPGLVADTTTTSAPGETTTTALPDTTTTEHEPDETTTTTAQPSPPSVWTGVVYLIQTPENSFLSNPALVPVPVEIEAPSGVFPGTDGFTHALSVLDETGYPAGFSNAIPSGVTVIDQRVNGSVLVVEMSESFVAGAGGALADFTMLNQLIYTLTLDDPTLEVLFTVNSQPVDAFGSEGLVLIDPVGRDTFIDHLAPMFLTEPLVESGTSYTVTGMSNVFEATLWIDVIDGAGNVAYEDFVTAECGSGCWGAFSTTIPAGVVVPGESSIRVFTHSMEDGSMIDIVTVPLPEGGVWRVSIDD